MRPPVSYLSVPYMVISIPRYALIWSCLDASTLHEQALSHCSEAGAFYAPAILYNSTYYAKPMIAKNGFLLLATRVEYTKLVKNPAISC